MTLLHFYLRKIQLKLATHYDPWRAVGEQGEIRTEKGCGKSSKKAAKKEKCTLRPDQPQVINNLSAANALRQAL